jgi:hypothetical protein
VRYLPTEVAVLRPILEIGTWTKSDASFSFRREYANGAGDALGEGYTDGSISNAFARAGDRAARQTRGSIRINSRTRSHPTSAINRGK